MLLYQLSTPYISVESDLSTPRENIVSVAKKVGLDEVELENVQALLDCHKEELLSQDLLELEKWKEPDKAESKEEVDAIWNLSAKWLKVAFSIIESTLAILDEDTPNCENSFKVRRNVHSALQCYWEILQEKKNQSHAEYTVIILLQNIARPDVWQQVILPWHWQPGCPIPSSLPP